MEVLAALGIFSIAALGLVHVSTENTRTAGIIETRALAGIVADNRLTERLTAPGNLVIGAETEIVELAGRTWIVNETIAQTSTNGILQIQIEAVEQSGENEPGAPRVERLAFRSVTS